MKLKVQVLYEYDNVNILRIKKLFGFSVIPDITWTICLKSPIKITFHENKGDDMRTKFRERINIR